MPADTCAVSVVVAAYNAAPYLRACLDSVLAQTLADWELIVVDDRSTDDTAAIVAEYAARDRRVKPMQTPQNSGPSAARNLGFDAARGTWLAILDADDRYVPERLQRMVAHGASAGSDFVSDNLLIVTAEDPEGSRMFKSPAMQAAHRVGPEEFILGNISKVDEPRVAFGYMKPLMRRQFVEGRGLRYDPKLRLSEDFKLYMAGLRAGARWDYVPEPMYLYAVRDDSLASSSGLPKPEELRHLYEFARELARSEMAQSDPGTQRAADLYMRRVRRWTSYGSLMQYVKKGQVGEVVALFVRSPDAIGDMVAEAMVQAPLIARNVVRKVARR